LIISDQRMPQMTGAQFFEEANKISPSAIRFLLTGYSDMEAVIDAVNKGEIHRYLTKPWNDDDLILQVRQGLEQFELVLENGRLLDLTKEQNHELSELNRDLEKKVKERTREIDQKNEELNSVNVKLEDSFIHIIGVLSSFVETLNPELGKHMKMVATLSKKIAEEYGLSRKEIEEIKIAGMLHDIGLLSLPKKLIKKDERELSEKELEMFILHPTIGQMCLQSVHNLEKVGEIILHHHEHYDGSGFPNRVAGEEIPIGARIICAVSDFCKMSTNWPSDVGGILKKAKIYMGDSANELLVADRNKLVVDIENRILLSRGSKKYDPAVVLMLLDRTESNKNEQEKSAIVQVHFNDLKEGMALASTLRTIDGREVLAAGTPLNKRLLTGIKRLGQGKAIKEHVHILKND